MKKDDRLSILKNKPITMVCIKPYNGFYLNEIKNNFIYIVQTEVNLYGEENVDLSYSINEDDDFTFTLTYKDNKDNINYNAIKNAHEFWFDRVVKELNV